jgi:flagella basal body P-ring formation protein FlgA
MENIAAVKQAQPTVQVFTLARAVKKGEKLTPNTFVTELALAHRSPQNAVTQLQGRNYYAARQLLPGRILVQSDLAVGQQVVVLTQAVPSRSPVTREHMAIQERAIDIPHDAVRSLEGLSMLAANRLLHPGDILRKRDLAKAKLIKRGQTVDVVSLGKHFRIASELVALQDGYLGDQIVLRNPGSNRRVSAVVTGMGTARSASGL